MVSRKGPGKETNQTQAKRLTINLPNPKNTNRHAYRGNQRRHAIHNCSLAICWRERVHGINIITGTTINNQQ